MSSRLPRARPELVVLTATAISAVNILVVLGLVHVASAHLAVINVGLACVIGLLARELVPSEPAGVAPEDLLAQDPQGGSAG
jgi:hypothetical protein